MTCDLIDCISYFRQRDCTKGDQCSQGELEQHGGASTGRAGGLQSKKTKMKLMSCRYECLCTECMLSDNTWQFMHFKILVFNNANSFEK